MDMTRLPVYALQIRIDSEGRVPIYKVAQTRFRTDSTAVNQGSISEKGLISGG